MIASISFISIALLVLFTIFRLSGAWVLGFLFIQYLSQLISFIFLDLNGQGYSDNLKQTIFPGDASLYFVFVVLFTLVPYWYIFQPNRLIKLVGQPDNVYKDNHIRFFRNITLVVFAAYIIGLYVDMFRIGIVPVYHCIERYDYTQYAGILHLPLFKYAPVFAMIAGGLTVYGKIRGKTFDYAFFIPFLLVVAYYVATGHRLSSLIVLTFYYLMPIVSVLVFWKPLIKSYNSSHELKLSAREIGAFIALITLTGLISLSAIYYSYTTIRAFGCTSQITQTSTADSKDKKFEVTVDKREGNAQVGTQRVSERVFVQSGEMWVKLVERIQDDNIDTKAAWNFVLFDPGLSGGDVAVSYLMTRVLGHDEGLALRASGVQFQTSYPAIYFELFGSVWGWPMIVISCIIMAFTIVFWIKALVSGRALAFCMISYMYFAMSSLYSSGTFSFLIAWTFWTKLSLSIFFYWLEGRASYAKFASQVLDYVTLARVKK